MKSLFSRFVKDESGATVIEYALLASLIGVALVAAISGMTTKISGKFGQVGSNMGS